MSIEDTVAAIKRAAINEASKVRNLPDTLETRMAYVRGISDMATLVNICSVTAERMARDAGNDTNRIIFEGYAKALRCIVQASEDLVPPGHRT